MFAFKSARGRSAAAAPYVSFTPGNPAVSHPAAADPPPRTTHEIINAEVRDLNVVCTGVEGDRVFFEAYGLPPNKTTQELISTLIERLGRTPEPARSALRGITSISLTVRKSS